MNALLTESFTVENQEVKELIHNIKTNFEQRDKPAFLQTLQPLVDLGLAASSEDEKEFYRKNVYQILQEIPKASSMHLIQSLIQTSELNEILGDSDEIFHYLKAMRKEADSEDNSELSELLSHNYFSN